mgnify:CR=1 FL=1
MNTDLHRHHANRLQMVVFALVAAAFTNIYITQPVLPVLQVEFNTDTVVVSYTVAAVILGVAIATLLFGSLVDHLPIKLLPKDTSRKMMAHRHTNYRSQLCRRDLLRIYFLASGSFFIFSAISNFLPFRLQSPPFGLSTAMITLLYLVYVMGIFIGPVAGRLSHRFGSGRVLTTGLVILAISSVITLLPVLIAIVIGLVGICAGFFTVHAAAVGLLNRRLSGGEGRANALYVLCYYIGGWIGITLAGLAYETNGWEGVVQLCMLMMVPLMAVGLMERKLTD